MDTKWQSRDVPLEFQVSDLTLFAVKLRLQSREIELLAELPPVTDVFPPADPLEPGSAGFLIRSLPVSGPLPPIARSGGYLCYVLAQYQRYYIDLRQSFADYQQQFSAKTRATIKRKVRRYADAGGGEIRWQTYRTAAEMPLFYQLARAVSARTYQEIRLGAGLPTYEKFYRRMLALAAADQVRGFILFSGSQPVSYLYCPAADGVLRFTYLGYDPDFAKFSVGTVLLWLALESLFDEGRFRIFDFTEGQSEHKRLFSTHSSACANVCFLQRNAKNALLVQCHRRFNSLARALGRCLETFGCKNRIKRFIRFGRRPADRGRPLRRTSAS